MKLVIGGAFQGKRNFIRETFPEYYPDKVFDLNGEIDRLYEGLIDEEIDMDIFFPMIINGHENDIVLTTEVGSGIVPVGKKERKYREIIGKAQVITASNSDEVYRVIAGIGQRIK